MRFPHFALVCNLFPTYLLSYHQHRCVLCLNQTSMNNDANNINAGGLLVFYYSLISTALAIYLPLINYYNSAAHTENYVILKRLAKIYFPPERRAWERMRQLRIIEQRAFERRGRPMIDRGLKQIAVAKATPVLDGPLPVSTPLIECGPCHTRRPRPRPPLTVSRSADRIGSDRRARARARTRSVAQSQMLSSPRPIGRTMSRRCARERTSGKMERGEIR